MVKECYYQFYLKLFQLYMIRPIKKYNNFIQIIYYVIKLHFNLKSKFNIILFIFKFF